MKSIKWILGLAGLGLGAALLYSKPAHAAAKLESVQVRAGDSLGIVFWVPADDVSSAASFEAIREAVERSGNVQLVRVWRLRREKQGAGPAVWMLFGRALRAFTAFEFDGLGVDTEIFAGPDENDELETRVLVFLQGRGLAFTDFEEITAS